MKLDLKKSGIALAGVGVVTLAALGGTAAFADDTTSDSTTTDESTIEVKHGRHGHLGTAAEYLGLTETELFTELEAGKSLADIAAEQGKTTEGLVDALLAEAEADITEMVNNPMPERSEEMGPGGRGGHHRGGHHGLGGHDYEGEVSAVPETTG